MQLNQQHFQTKPDNSFYVQLIKCEQSIIATPSVDILTTLMQMYRKCIEYYDSQHDPIKVYFIDKMQQILSKSNTLMAIIQNTTSTQVQTPLLSDIKLPNLCVSPIKNKKSNSKQFNLLVNLSQPEFDANNYVDIMVSDFSSNLIKQEQLIKEQLQQQESHITDRLLMRRNKYRQQDNICQQNINDNIQ